MKILCKICGIEKNTRNKDVRTCGSKECKLEYRHRYYRFTPERKKKISEIAKAKGFGKWMIGKKASKRAIQLSRERWLGNKNPRWNGGVTLKQAHKNWMKKNPTRNSYYCKIRKARKKGAKGKYSFQEWENLKKCYNYTCPCCGISEPKIKLTVDHIKPICKGGSNQIKNIQPLCEKCNNKKHTKTIKYPIWNQHVTPAGKIFGNRITTKV